MNSRRLGRVNELIRTELSDLLLTHVNDPRLSQIVSITSVDVSLDLGLAKVYVSVMGGGEEKRDSLKGLSNAAGFLRRELGRKIKLKKTPALRFILDDSIEEGERVMTIIRGVTTLESSGTDAPRTTLS